MKKITLILLLLIITSCTKTGPNPINNKNNVNNHFQDSISIHVSLGLPRDADSSDDYIIIRHQYVLSYNKNRNVANWVAWELDSSWFGDTPRYSGNFITDTSLPAGFYRVVHSDYTNSGYDRGHMVMSEERTDNAEDNKATFILTNVLPQTPDLNRGVWLKFENYCNRLCLDSNKELFIYAGGIFHTNTTIKNNVAVPDSCFKIVVVLDSGQGLKDVNENTPVYAVVMPNIAGVRNDDWEQYKTTVRRIEKSTGYDFLSAVKKSVQDVIENR
jgi:endonuclease G